jgi:hypothetical protein
VPSSFLYLSPPPLTSVPYFSFSIFFSFSIGYSSWWQSESGVQLLVKVCHNLWCEFDAHLFFSAVFGHVCQPNGCQASVASCDLLLPNLGEHPGSLPQHVVLRFSGMHCKVC